MNRPNDVSTGGNFGTAMNRYQRQRALLQEALDEYVVHQNWRCSESRCRCGLDDFERRAREELADD